MHVRQSCDGRIRSQICVGISDLPSFSFQVLRARNCNFGLYREQLFSFLPSMTRLLPFSFSDICGTETTKPAVCTMSPHVGLSVFTWERCGSLSLDSSSPSYLEIATQRTYFCFYSSRLSGLHTILLHFRLVFVVWFCFYDFSWSGCLLWVRESRVAWSMFLLLIFFIKFSSPRG